MLIYWSIFLLISVASLLPLKLKERKILAILICTGFIILCGLRASITPDYDAYMEKYKALKNGEVDEGIEFSFTIISNLVAGTIDHINGVMLIYAVLTIVPLTYAILVQTKSFLLVFVYYYSYYFFLHPMTQIREAVAAAFLLVSLQFIKEKKLKTFLVVIMIGTFFHVSLLLFIPFYFVLNNVRLTFKTALICFIICLAISKLHLLNLVLSFDLNSDAYIISKLYMHKSTIEGGMGERTAGIYIIMIYLKLLFNFLLRFKIGTITKHSINFELFLNLHFYGCLSYILLSDLHIVGARVSELLCIVEVFMVPYFIYIFRPRLFGKILVLFICLFQFIIALYVVGLSGPYRLGIL